MKSQYEADLAKQIRLSLELCQQKNQEKEEFNQWIKGRYKVISVKADGCCFFSAAAVHIWGDPKKHAELRSQVVDYMSANKEIWDQVLRKKLMYQMAEIQHKDWWSEDELKNYGFDHYMQDMSKSQQHGTDVELNVIGIIYGHRFQILTTKKLVQTSVYTDVSAPCVHYKLIQAHLDPLVPVKKKPVQINSQPDFKKQPALPDNFFEKTAIEGAESFDAKALQSFQPIGPKSGGSSMIDYSSEQSKKMISDDLKQKPLEAEAVDALRIEQERAYQAEQDRIQAEEKALFEIISSICTSIEFSASPVAQQKHESSADGNEKYEEAKNKELDVAMDQSVKLQDNVGAAEELEMLKIREQNRVASMLQSAWRFRKAKRLDLFKLFDDQDCSGQQFNDLSKLVDDNAEIAIPIQDEDEDPIKSKQQKVVYYLGKRLFSEFILLSANAPDSRGTPIADHNHSQETEAQRSPLSVNACLIWEKYDADIARIVEQRKAEEELGFEYSTRERAIQVQAYYENEKKSLANELLALQKQKLVTECMVVMKKGSKRRRLEFQEKEAKLHDEITGLKQEIKNLSDKQSANEVTYQQLPQPGRKFNTISKWGCGNAMKWALEQQTKTAVIANLQKVDEPETTIDTVLELFKKINKMDQSLAREIFDETLDKSKTVELFKRKKTQAIEVDVTETSKSKSHSNEISSDRNVNSCYLTCLLDTLLDNSSTQCFSCRFNSGFEGKKKRQKLLLAACNNLENHRASWLGDEGEAWLLVNSFVNSKLRQNAVVNRASEIELYLITELKKRIGPDLQKMFAKSNISDKNFVKDNLIVLAYCILANKTPTRRGDFTKFHELDMSQLEHKLANNKGYNELIQNLKRAISVFAYYKVQKKQLRAEPIRLDRDGNLMKLEPKQ